MNPASHDRSAKGEEGKRLKEVDQRSRRRVSHHLTNFGLEEICDIGNKKFIGLMCVQYCSVTSNAHNQIIYW